MKKLILENEYIKLSCLPERGGKIVSLLNNQSKFEWLYQKPNTVIGAHLDNHLRDFDSSESFGIDEMFPTILPYCRKQSVGKCIEEPDHGWLWRFPWDINFQNDNKISLSCCRDDLAWNFHRTIELNANQIIFSYCLENLTDSRFPGLWALHPLFSMYPETVVSIPKTLRYIIQAADGKIDGGLLGAYGSRHKIEDIPFSLFRPSCTPYGKALKFYNAEPLKDGRFSIQDRRGNLELEFSSSKIPWIGFWINRSGWGGQENFALEPASAPMDSPEKSSQFGTEAYVQAYAACEWKLNISV